MKPTLSPRQIEIATLVRRGKTSRQIGEALFIDRRTVETHIETICRKLNVRTRVEMVAELFGPIERRSLEEGPAESNLPIPLTSLIGRASEIADVTRTLENTRLVTLLGPGGIGKTRVALQVGSESVNNFPDGVWLIELASLTSGEYVDATIASALRVATIGSNALESLLAQLRTKNALLIIDNCEHLVPHVARVISAVLRACRNIRILTTTRERLRIEGESLCHILPLAAPSVGVCVTAVSADTYAAVGLFAQRARAVNQRFGLTDKNATTIGEICRRLDGIPLAIELAAARTSVMGLQQIRDRLPEKLLILSGGNSDAEARHQTLRGAFDWSYDLLQPRERTLFRRLSVFAGGWTLEAAEAVCADEGVTQPMIIELLTSLIDKSLVLFEYGEALPRYRFLEIARTFAREKLEASGEANVVAERHLAWMASFADRSDLSGWHEPLASWLPQVTCEFDNARSALNWAHRIRSGARAAGIIAAAFGQWAYACGLVREARECVKLELARGELDDDPDVAARLWNALGQLSWGAERVELCERAAAVFRKLGDRHRLARNSVRLAGGYQQTGAYIESDATLCEALAILRDIGEEQSSQAALALSWHATLYRITNRLSQARDLLIDSIRIFERIGDEKRAAVEKVNLAELEFAVGETERAIELVQEAIDVLQTADAKGFRMGSAFRVTALQNAAAYAIVLRDATRAHTYARASLNDARLTGTATWITRSIEHFATVAAMRKQTAVSGRLWGYCNEVLRRHAIVREPTEQRTYDLLLTLLRSQADEAEIAVWRSDGMLLTENEAIDLALSL